MVVEVSHDYMSLVIETHTSRRVKVFPKRSLEAVLVDERAVWCEELDAVVSGVGHQDLAFRVDCQIPWVVELAVFRSLLTKLEEERSVESEDLDAVVILISN